MNDTLIETEAYLEGRYRERSQGERIEMACGMFATAVQLARAGICAEAAGLSESEIRLRLLGRLYGDDLPPQMMEQISARIRRGANVPVI